MATAPGEGARPCLRHLDPTGPCAPPWVPPHPAPRKRNLGVRAPAEARVRGACPAAEASSHHPLPSSNGSARGACRGPRRQATWDCSIGPTAGDAVEERGLVAMATGGSPQAGLRAGRPPECLPAAHIRAQEEVGPALSWGPEPEVGSPSICQDPGRAWAPGLLVPTSPDRRPRGPHGRLAQPRPAPPLWGCVLPGRAWPNPARQVPACPRAWVGLRPRPDGARRGRADASRRPRRLGGLERRLPPPSGGVPFPSARRSGAPSPTPRTHSCGSGAPLSFESAGPIHPSSRIPRGSPPSFPRVAPSSEGFPPPVREDLKI